MEDQQREFITMICALSVRRSGRNNLGQNGPKLSRSASLSEGIAAKATVPETAPPSPPPKGSKPASDVVAGTLARAASQSTIHPLDTLKVRMQTNNETVNGLSKFGKLVPPAGGREALKTAKVIGSGVASLYKGVFSAASGAGIAIGAYFAFYSVTKNVLASKTRMPAGAVAFSAGAIAAAGSSVVKVPLAVCIRSVQAGVYSNVVEASAKIIGAAGPRGLFVGYLPTLLEDVPDMACKFAAYETLRSIFMSCLGGRRPSPHEDFAIGATAGAFAAAATTPLDVIKTNMMCTAASRPSMMVTARNVYASSGIRGMFAGVGPRAVSNGINSAVFFCFFESFRAMIQAHQERAAALAEREGPEVLYVGVKAGKSGSNVQQADYSVA